MDLPRLVEYVHGARRNAWVSRHYCRARYQYFAYILGDILVLLTDYPDSVLIEPIDLGNMIIKFRCDEKIVSDTSCLLECLDTLSNIFLMAPSYIDRLILPE
jgi:hypothetical protein